MALLSAILVFVLVSGGVFLLAKRRALDVVLGLLLLSHGVNVLILSVGGWRADSRPPIIQEAPREAVLEDGTKARLSAVDPDPYVDPLPQALMLTAIVISFGVTALFLVLVARGHEETRSLAFTDDGDGEGTS
jgi:multisubunit Na+/H+ antiporter MnhC subunit